MQDHYLEMNMTADECVCHKPMCKSHAAAVHRYIVIPRRPDGTEGWSKERLKQLVTRDSMVGVTLAKSPQLVA